MAAYILRLVWRKCDYQNLGYVKIYLSGISFKCADGFKARMGGKRNAHILVETHLREETALEIYEQMSG
jgi:hypothetical protein